MKTACVVTEICCALLVFIFVDLVWCWWHIIKQIFHAFFMLNLVKRVGFAFFLPSHCFGFTQSFQIFAHAYVCNR